MRRAPLTTALAALTVLLLAVASAPTVSAATEQFYWEVPRPLVEGAGRYPTAIQVDGGILVVWQESEIAAGGKGEASGQAWLSRARFSAGGWEIERRFAGPFEFKGSEPVLFTAAAANERDVAVAVAAGDGEVDVLLSADGGRSFEKAVRPAPSGAAVAPRIFPSASGGWLLFVTQGEAESLRLYCSTSRDGATWGPFAPFVGEAEGLSLSFLPTAIRIPSKRKDLVVFQSLSGGSRATFQLYAKTTADGGESWSEARRVTSFEDPVATARKAPDDFDNQRPYLGSAGGRLWLTWERKNLGSEAQVYAMALDENGVGDTKTADRVSSGAGAASAPELLEVGGNPAALWTDNRRGGSRLYIAVKHGIEWEETELSGSRGEAAFGRAALGAGKLYAFWQSTESGRDRILVLEPDTTVSPPSLAALGFTPGKRTRSETASVRITLPPDSSGMAGYSYVWGRDASATPPQKLMALPTQGSVSLDAKEDGAWYLAVSAVDYAGNWSRPARIRFDRDRTPPPGPIFMPPDLDDSGFLASNSFTVRWLTPETKDGAKVDDLAGYTWELRYIGELEGAQRVSLKGRAGAAGNAGPGKAALPGLSAYETGLVSQAGPLSPPQALLGTNPAASYSNIDNGYYLFAAAAIDSTGNIGPSSSILIRANKYVPYTALSYATASRDDFGRTTLKILGKGFNIDGRVTRVVLDRDGKEPYDVDGELAKGSYRIVSDREIEGFSFEDLDAGRYRLGIYHPRRGWFWSGPVVAIDASGTLKFGEPSPAYQPSWRLAAPRSYRFSIYDAIVLAALLFAAAGIFLSSAKAIAAARDVEEVRKEVLALVSGGPMPSAEKQKEMRKLRRRGAGLRAKFTLTITLLVILTVVLVAGILGVSMVRTESSSLASGLEQRAHVLLESVAQGARSYLPSENILELGFLPQQAQAMNDAVYITVTGYASDSSTDADVVWATNDPDILKKIDTKAFEAGVSRLKDGLSPSIPAMASELNAKAAADVGPENDTLAALTREGKALATKLDEASQRRLTDISGTSRDLERDIAQKLFVIAGASIGSSPSFDPAVAARREGRYLFYKPVLYRKGQDQAYYRGMVRLEVSTSKIVADVRDAQAQLIRQTLIIAAAALAFGILGAFILSSIIVDPIKKLVKTIETIRDTEDKEKLEDLSIEVKSHDELFTLAETVNQMTTGLAKAAKASKDLTIGKGIQKMFIPLDTAPGSKSKLSTGSLREKNFEIFGYYEGAKGVSGDYWDFRPINSRYYYFIKCDVSGKGVPAALIMVQVATMVINYFNPWKATMPASFDLSDLAYRINDFLEERQFPGRFAAFTLGVWDAEAGKAYICHAGDNKLPIWNARKAELANDILPESPAAGPLASFMIQMKQPYKQVVRSIERGDILFLYTDGIDEARRRLRDASFAVLTCDYSADPHAFLAAFLVRELKLAEGQPGGEPILAGPAQGEAFAAALSAALKRELAAQAWTKLLNAAMDEAIEQFCRLAMEELAPEAGAGAGRREGPGDAASAAKKLQPTTRRALKAACAQAMGKAEAGVQRAFITRPSEDFRASLAGAAAEESGNFGAALAKRLAEQICEAVPDAQGRQREYFESLHEVIEPAARDENLATRVAGLVSDRLKAAPDSYFAALPEALPLKHIVEEPLAELGACVKAALEGKSADPKSAKGIREASPSVIDKLAEKLIPERPIHENHGVGLDYEEFGEERIKAVLAAVDAKGRYRLKKSHDPVPNGELSFDFSSCEGSLEDKVMALISVEKVFRLYPDPSAGERDSVVIDEKVDAFLLKHFDQVRLYRKEKLVRPLGKDSPGYLTWGGIREDEQYDDLTILGIQRK